ncbi:GTP cyclohydrolase II [[Eubacterium] cellulosolvens]
MKNKRTRKENGFKRLSLNDHGVSDKSQTTSLTLQRLKARIPVSGGEFCIYLYPDFDNMEHLALVMGDVRGKKNVLVRIHSECLTGESFNSQRCDCGEQLKQSIQMISDDSLGIIIYLRQEGRGIGLAKKLQAYNLQDNGYDTIDANIALGHKPDERDFTIAAYMLKDLGVKSIKLISNNPGKFKPLIDSGIVISSRMPILPRLTPENAPYIRTKISRMNHNIDFDGLSSSSPEREMILRYIVRKMKNHRYRNRPFITLSYAQSLDGCISKDKNKSMVLSDEESMILTHQIRSIHDAILVGIGTILTDDPQLTVRKVQGKNPQPIILDTNLKFPLNAKLLKEKHSPWIISGKDSDVTKQKILEDLGVKIFRLPVKNNNIDLQRLISKLVKENIGSIMVEGGAEVISSFMLEKLADFVVSTVTPRIIGRGVRPLEQVPIKMDKLVSLQNTKYVQIGKDLIVFGVPRWINIP